MSKSVRNILVGMTIAFVVVMVYAFFAITSPALAQNGCPAGTTWEQGACVPNAPAEPVKAPECNIFCQVAKFWTPTSNKPNVPVVKPVVKTPAKVRTLPTCQPGYGLNNRNVCVKITVDNVAKEVSKPGGFFAWVACMSAGGGSDKCGSGK